LQLPLYSCPRQQSRQHDIRGTVVISIVDTAIAAAVEAVGIASIGDAVDVAAVAHNRRGSY
jgi:hypothetical protein